MNTKIGSSLSSLSIATVLTLFACLLPVPAHSQQSISVSPLIWGAQLRLETEVSAGINPVILGGSFGAAFGSTPYLRRVDGVPFQAGQLDIEPIETSVTSTYTGWNVDLSRALLRNSRDESLVSVFFGYWGRLDNRFDESGESSLFSAVPPPKDYQGQLLNSFRTGVEVGHVRTLDRAPLLEGADATATVEWAPAWLGNEVIGSADFMRFSAEARGFIPISAGGGENEHQAIGVYGGAHIIGDYTVGSNIPILVRSSFGGRSGRSGLAGTVRGYESGRFDSVVKAATGAELRIVGPALAAARFTPGLVLYGDAGYYSGYEGSDPASEDDSGWIASTGAGLSLSFLETVTLVFYSNLVLAEELLTGGRLNPFAVGFGYHF
ncbi:MAG: hypothetical protein ACOC4I_03995 [Spirochaetota bacterium]